MNSEQKTDRYKYEKEKIIVEVGVKSLRQLFNERDHAPFRDRDLIPQFVTYLDGGIEEFLLRTKIKIRILTADDDDIKPENSLAIQDAIRAYFRCENELTVSSLETLSHKSPLSVVVDFGAPWCAPCRSFTPTFIEAASRLKSRIVFGKINSEAHPNAEQKFATKGIPTLVIFYRGKEVSRMSGALPVDEFLGWVNQMTQALV